MNTDNKYQVTMPAETWAEFEARDRAAYPHAWAVHDHMMRQMRPRKSSAFQRCRAWIVQVLNKTFGK